MIEFIINTCYSCSDCTLGFSVLCGLGIVISVKRQFKYWSNRAISTCLDKHVLTTMPIVVAALRNVEVLPRWEIDAV